MSVARSMAAEGSAPGWPLVLYFHHVTAHINHYTALSPSDFRRGLELCLKRFGPAMAPDTIEAALAAPPDHPQFLVTFDDGYTDVAEHALPILTDLGISCVHFLISDAVETGQCKGIPAPRAPFLDRKGIADLTASGHRLGAHSRSHARFDTLDAAELARETDQDTFAYSCDRGAARRLFAYPYGALPRSGLSLAPNTLAFATASVPARAWDKAPQAIRRTFLPSDDIDSWPKLTDHWRRSWNP